VNITPVFLWHKVACSRTLFTRAMPPAGLPNQSRIPAARCACFIKQEYGNTSARLQPQYFTLSGLPPNHYTKYIPNTRVEESMTDVDNITENQESSREYEYMLLGRLKMDLDYYLGFGNRNAKHLFYDSIEEHMSEIKKALAAFPEDRKPEWFTEQDLQDYESKIMSGNT
jgi:hypothetical protein